MKSVRVIDVPTESTATQAEQMINAVCSEGYRIRMMQPANQAACVRVFFELRSAVNPPISHNATAQMTRRVYATFKPGEPVKYKKDLGSESTFYRWLKLAKEQHLLMKSKGEWCLAPNGDTPRIPESE